MAGTWVYTFLAERYIQATPFHIWLWVGSLAVPAQGNHSLFTLYIEYLPLPSVNICVCMCMYVCVCMCMCVCVCVCSLTPHLKKQHLLFFSQKEQGCWASRISSVRIISTFTSFMKSIDMMKNLIWRLLKLSFSIWKGMTPLWEKLSLNCP